jgi:hypothetical protein
MRFLHLIRPVMCVLPEVASPDRKVRHDKLKKILFFFLGGEPLAAKARRRRRDIMAWP